LYFHFLKFLFSSLAYAQQTIIHGFFFFYFIFFFILFLILSFMCYLYI
jgi:hypothetical protein